MKVGSGSGFGQDAPLSLAFGDRFAWMQFLNARQRLKAGQAIVGCEAGCMARCGIQ
ncbi:MAG TPA: hypothetical protein GX700_13380 [Paracoccus sp.]|nr:hypothetical protein [Paracoccus sp. (in: a-proteobacteria)]